MDVEHDRVHGTTWLEERHTIIGQFNDVCCIDRQVEELVESFCVRQSCWAVARLKERVQCAHAHIV